MAREICFRQIKKKDFLTIRKILAKTWELKEYTKNKFIRNLIFKHNLYLYLAKTNFTLVASKKGKPVGVLLARIEKNYSLSQTIGFKIQLKLITFILMFCPSGREYLKENKQIKKIDRKLREQHRRNYGAELVLFVVNSHYQGQGIGSKLMNTFIDYLKKKKINTYYLYTDDYCDVNYYVKHEYTKLGEKKIILCDEDEPSSFYLFSYNIRKHKQNTKPKKSRKSVKSELKNTIKEHLSENIEKFNNDTTNQENKNDIDLENDEQNISNNTEMIEPNEQEKVNNIEINENDEQQNSNNLELNEIDKKENISNIELNKTNYKNSQSTNF